MAYQSPTTNAKGDAAGPYSGPNKTPAPIGEVTPPYETGNRLDENRGSALGRNQYSGPSSLPPGKTLTNDFSADIVDPVLSAVRERGSAHDHSVDSSGRGGIYQTDGQVRQLSGGNVSTAFGMKGAARGPTIPGALVNDQENPVRQPSRS